MQPPALRLFAVLFFLSGAAGLVYEVCWTRLLRLPMGNTVHSLTVVLAAFMGGLALGAWLAGRWIERRGHPLRAYAALEAAIGLFCFALPWIVQAETPLFRWAYRAFADSPVLFIAIKFAATGIVVLVPATLMGATLPILCRWFIVEPGRIGASVGTLYAVNALGAATGALLAGFVLVPALGLRGAMHTAVAISLGVALVAWRASRASGSELGSDPAQPRKTKSAAAASATGRGSVATAPLTPVSPTLAFAVLAGYALSGVAAMILQIAWARVLALVLGSSTYAFSLLVAAFILGLAAGAAVAARFADRLARPAVGFAVMQIGIAVTALALVPLFARAPEWILGAVPRFGSEFGRFQFLQFVWIFAALLLPTACMGACLPLASRVLAAKVQHAAATVGRAYAWNAIGTIAGACLGGLVLLPRLGAHATIVFAATLGIAVGTVVLWLALPHRRLYAVGGAVGAVAVAVGLVVVAPRFDPAVMASGAYLYASAMRQEMGEGRTLRQHLRDQYVVRYEREGLVSHTIVRDGPDGVRSLLLNGKVDASDGPDMTTQVLLGHVPALLHPVPRTVAVVGLASGVTLGAIGVHPSVEALDCVEIAPETVDACRLFDHVNHTILDDQRVRIVLEDGRNHLALGDREYDLIVSEPSNPWIAGIASLFTVEFFSACRARLRPDGVVCIWLQLYGSSLDVVRTVARTFQRVFPEATLWESVFGADYLLVGSKGSLAVGWDDLARRMQQPQVATDLARIGIHAPADLVAHHLASGDELRQWIGAGAVYTDDRNRLEFDAPRLMHRPLTPQDMQEVRALARPYAPSWIQVPAAGVPAADVAALATAYRARDTFWRGFVLQMQGKPVEALQAYRAALADNAHIAGTVPAYVEDAAAAVHAQMLARGDTVGVETSARELLALQPGLVGTRLDLARLLASRRDAAALAAAETELRAALAQRPRDPAARLELAAVVDRSGRRSEAEAEVQRVLDERPEHTPALLSMGNYLLQRRDFVGAEAHYRSALAVDSGSPVAWFLLANCLHEAGRHEDALKAAQRAHRIEPHVRSTRELMALCYRELGRDDEATRILAQ